MPVQPDMVKIICWQCGYGALFQPQHDASLLPACQLCQYHMTIIRSATLADKLHHPVEWLQNIIKAR